MAFIVFDLEWNIGYKPRMFDYHGAEQTLRGEIIQIGAVKIDEQCNVLDTFSMNLQPRIFRKLQHHIAKVTGLTQHDLDHGVPIREGLSRFVRWCGPDACFGEWGMDDVPVLKQNLFLNNLDERWPAVWYDLQQIFESQKPRGEGEGMNLEAVITRMGIAADRPFHNALADALYTVDVCRCVDLKKGLEAYPSPEEALVASACPEGPEYLGVKCFYGFLEKEAWRTDKDTRDARCPSCGGMLLPETVKQHEEECGEQDKELWLRKGSNSYYSLCTCAECRERIFIRYKLARRDGLHWAVARVYEKTAADSLARWEKQKKMLKDRKTKKEKEDQPES